MKRGLVERRSTQGHSPRMEHVLLNLRAQETTSNVSRINTGVQIWYDGQSWRISDALNVGGHGRARVTGLGCCGSDWFLAVSYPDGTRYYAELRQCTMLETMLKSGGVCMVKKLKWADAEDVEDSVAIRRDDN